MILVSRWFTRLLVLSITSILEGVFLMEKAAEGEVEDVRPTTLEAIEVEYQSEPKEMKSEHFLGLVSGLDEEVSTTEKVQDVEEISREINAGTEGKVELEDTLTEYEKARLQNVLRNQQFLRNLGIFNIKSSLEVRPPKRPWTKYVHPLETPLRRSIRSKVPSRKNYFSHMDHTEGKLVRNVDRVGSKKKRFLDEKAALKDNYLLDEKVPVKKKHFFDEEVAVKENCLSDEDVDVKENVQDIGKASSEVGRIVKEAVELEDELTEYEKVRLQNVLRNQHFLQNLGVFTIKSALEVRPPKKTSRKYVHPPGKPLRRSIRSKLPSRKNDFSDVDYTESNTVYDMNTFSGKHKRLLDRSSFTTYICATDRPSYHYDDPSSIDWSKLVGFRSLRESLVDRDLDRITTMDILTDGTSGLLAVGDLRGRITVFDTNYSSNLSSKSFHISTRSSELINEEDFERPRLCSWKEWEGGRAFSGTEIQFLSQQLQETKFLLSTFRNGGLALWDLNKQCSDQAQPHAQAMYKSLHSKEILGMHELNRRIATASFDSLLVTSTITQAGIVQERVITGHHAGTISGVRFREANILADCGQDSRICILDLRAPIPCVSAINTMQKSEIRVVEWNPMQDSILLSTSKRPHLLVHDIRSYASPLYTLMGHTGTQMLTKVRKYRPAFVGDGSMVATPGEGSNMLTLYSLNTGMIMSQGFLGFDSTLVMSSRRSDSHGLNVWVPDSADPEFYKPRFRKPRILELAPIFQQ